MRGSYFFSFLKILFREKVGYEVVKEEKNFWETDCGEFFKKAGGGKEEKERGGE
jgi:hypothetical protein